MLPTWVHAAAEEKRIVAPPSCRQAVSQSRMVCVSGNDCQKEISLVLRVCDASAAASCVAARDDLRVFCSQPMPWDGSRGCESALRQVSHYCGR
jgi:hypothetical protein